MLSFLPCSTCFACNQVFKSLIGRKQHQKNRRLPACFRDGVNREIAAKKKQAKKHLDLWIHKKLPLEHHPLFKKHDNTPFSSQAKQLCLNVYQSFRDDGYSVAEVVSYLEIKYSSFIGTLL